MKLVKLFGIALIALGLSTGAVAQQAAGQQDQVAQIAKMVGLSDEQQKEMRAIMSEMQPEIQALSMEAQKLQKEMQAQVKRDYDEEAIREKAQELGDVSAQIAEKSTIMQAAVKSVFTEEQQKKLDERIRQMQQQMQQGRQMQQ